MYFLEFAPIPIFLSLVLIVLRRIFSGGRFFDLIAKFKSARPNIVLSSLVSFDGRESKIEREREKDQARPSVYKRI